MENLQRPNKFPPAAIIAEFRPENVAFDFTKGFTEVQDVQMLRFIVFSRSSKSASTYVAYFSFFTHIDFRALGDSGLGLVYLTL